MIGEEGEDRSSAQGGWSAEEGLHVGEKRNATPMAEFAGSSIDWCRMHARGGDTRVGFWWRQNW